MSILSQRSLAGGEISPALAARADTNKYQSAVAVGRNVYVKKHGALTNRPGTSFVAEIKDSSKTVRLVDFVFNSTAGQTYVLEFGDQYMRVILNGSYVYETATVVNAMTTAAQAEFTTTTPHGYSTGQEVFIDDIVYAPTGSENLFANGRSWVLDVTGASTFKLKYRDGTYFSSVGFTYTSGGTASRVYTIVSPYTEAQIPDIQWVQSGDVLTITHPSVEVKDLTRTSSTSWAFSAHSFSPRTTAPTGLATSAAGATQFHVVTAVAPETFEESLPTSPVGSNAVGVTLTWNYDDTYTGSGVKPVEYNVYRRVNGVYGFVGIARYISGVTVSFTDSTGYTPDASDSPPSARTPMSASNKYPATVAYIQQRLTLGGSNNEPETIYMSRSGQFTNFTISAPLQADDAVTFSLTGRQVNRIKHIIDLAKPVVFTSAGEHIIGGDADGVISPTTVNLKQHSYNGSASLRPITINSNAVYLQGRENLVRDLGFDYTLDGYTGNDLTRFATHLFENYEISDWAYQQVPDSIIWAVRSDGVLLSLTYVREEQIFAWTRHDTDGVVERVAVIPEGAEDSVYLVVKRTINGSTVRYIERMNTRTINDIVDLKLLDSAISYDGRYTGAITITLSEYSSGGWLYTSTITATASSGYFASTDVGNQIFLTSSSGTVIRFTIDTFVSSTVVRGRPHMTVPSAMRSVAIGNGSGSWAIAVDELKGLWHLEGKEVSIFADGFVVGSPNNAAYTTYTVTSGKITLEKPYSVIHVGLPYTSDIENLDLEPGDNTTLIDTSKLISEVWLKVFKTRGVFAGPKAPSDDDTDPLENLFELKIREEETYDEPVDLKSGTARIAILPEWSTNGKVFIRQVDPLPMTILSIAPKGVLSRNRGG